MCRKDSIVPIVSHSSFLGVHHHSTGSHQVCKTLKIGYFSLFQAPPRAENGSPYGLPGFFRSQMSRGRSSENIRDIAQKLPLTFSKKTPPRIAGFGIRFFT